MMFCGCVLLETLKTRLRTILDDIVTKNNVIEESQKKNKELQIRYNNDLLLSGHL